MKINRDQLKDVVLEVAEEQFGSNTFGRRALMLAVEQFVKHFQLWTPADDEDSESADAKSKGLAEIDWAISTLKQEGHLLNPARDQWRVAPNQE
ncbi:MAG TPA: hypothetical protein PLE77_03000 [Kiritimatiellia bacterium]|nr:hypothetical protein [Kiritimatiellia bacterium]